MPSNPKMEESFSSLEYKQIVNSAISEGLNKNFKGSDSSFMSEIKTHNALGSEESQKPDMDLPEIKTHSFNEDGQSLDLPPMASAAVEESVEQERPVDIEQIAKEAYQKGYSEAETIYLPQIDAKREEENYLDLIKGKLSSLQEKPGSEEKIFTLAASLLSQIAGKLHLAIPADFDAVILGEMVPILNKYHKKDKVIVRVNPDKVDYCNNLFRIGELSEALKENIEIVSDENIAQNDCSVEWQDAALEYKQEDVANEVDKILDQLKSKIEN